MTLTFDPWLKKLTNASISTTSVYAKSGHDPLDALWVVALKPFIRRVAGGGLRSVATTRNNNIHQSVGCEVHNKKTRLNYWQYILFLPTVFMLICNIIAHTLYFLKTLIWTVAQMYFYEDVTIYPCLLNSMFVYLIVFHMSFSNTYIYVIYLDHFVWHKILLPMRFVS